MRAFITRLILEQLRLIAERVFSVENVDNVIDDLLDAFLKFASITTERFGLPEIYTVILPVVKRVQEGQEPAQTIVDAITAILGDRPMVVGSAPTSQPQPVAGSIEQLTAFACEGGDCSCE